MKKSKDIIDRITIIDSFDPNVDTFGWIHKKRIQLRNFLDFSMDPSKLIYKIKNIESKMNFIYSFSFVIEDERVESWIYFEKEIACASCVVVRKEETIARLTFNSLMNIC